MTIADYATFKSRMAEQVIVPFSKSGIPFSGSTNSLHSSTWTMTVGGATAPSISVALNSSSPGALNFEYGLTTTKLLSSVSADVGAAGSQLSVLVVDRLVHQGGLSGIVTTAQTTNLPTAALTRYTSGDGVMVALDVYTTLGGTATTVTISYTNQAGVSGRTSKARAISSALTNLRSVIIPLADGDTGVRSVESVTLAASTGTAGNFGVTLFKPLALLNPYFQGLEAYGVNNYNALLGGGCQFEDVNASACLSLMAVSTIGNSTISGTINLLDNA